MRYKLVLILSFVIFLYGRGTCQSCFNRGYLRDEGRGLPLNREWQTTEQYNASYIGCGMPEFKAYLTDGTVVSNLSLRGKIVFMYFWSAHEPLNIREVPYLNEIADSLRQKDVEFIAVCRDNPAKWDKKYERFFHFKHIVLSWEVLEKFPSYPTVIIFDDSGKTMFWDNIIYMTEPVFENRKANYLYVIGSGLSLMSNSFAK